MVENLLKSRQVRQFIQWLKQTSFLRGTVSLYDILINIVRSNRKFDIDQRASAVAYNFTLASFPAVIFLFTLIPYIPVADLDKQIMELLRDIIPQGIYKEVNHTILDIVSRPRKGILSLGFIFAMIASTNGMMSLMKSFDMIFGERTGRGFLKTRAVATMLTLLLVAVIFVSVILLVVGDAVMSFVSNWSIIKDSTLIVILNVSRYAVSFGAMMLAISLIYRFAPTNGRDFSFVNAGAMVATILILVSTFGFSFYLSNFSSYNKLYGSIGTLIALMIWLYLLAFLLILGFEINASISTEKNKVRKAAH
ncbi:hypothetical protein DYBT9275_00839 [Dyadobacter sp. CECT 9275]|uniref:YihY/virulence factor BrkB family protein n=1 Tax=Dyadobacter helix TaxID=2822344 RepID=A0A916J963_9BACT|nr:YihY/virulence factor BrkB family protein [Dyadobacter sp. CECT 9275]CAG4991837.1 hypothetical protein DYBT9275_00839 [Dyadobacter sp. CECT 9275]